MLTDKQRRAAAQSLIEAERDHAPIDPISTTYPGADVEDAYRISILVAEMKVAAGRSIKGHKIGLTSKAMRSLAGATEPDYGTLFDDWFVAEGSAISMSRMNRPLVEVELAFVFREPLAGPMINAAEVIHATDFVVPAIEIVDSRFNVRGTLVDSIADARVVRFRHPGRQSPPAHRHRHPSHRVPASARTARSRRVASRGR